MGGGVLLRPRLWAGLCSRARAPPAGPGGDFVPLCPVGSEGLPGTLEPGLPFLGNPVSSVTPNNVRVLAMEPVCTFLLGDLLSRLPQRS